MIRKNNDLKANRLFYIISLNDSVNMGTIMFLHHHMKRSICTGLHQSKDAYTKRHFQEKNNI